VKEDIEYYSVLRAMKALEECDVCILMLDAENGISAQDMSIFGEAKEKGKGVVLVVNKWDLLEKDNSTFLNYEKVFT
jgi:GTP-binding protein